MYAYVGVGYDYYVLALLLRPELLGGTDSSGSIATSTTTTTATSPCLRNGAVPVPVQVTVSSVYDT